MGAGSPPLSALAQVSLPGGGVGSKGGAGKAPRCLQEKGVKKMGAGALPAQVSLSSLCPHK